LRQFFYGTRLSKRKHRLTTCAYFHLHPLFVGCQCCISYSLALLAI
jgi:hypothetical protein